MNTLSEKNEFITQCIFRMEENIPRLKKCLLLLNDSEVWLKPNASCNSVGNLILHLTGNITQYILSSLGGKPDYRIRDEEFSTNGGMSRDALLTKISYTVTDAVNVIRNTTQEDLLWKRQVQGFELSGMGIVIHVVEHLSYHTGQIALITKLLKNQDLGFYKGVDLNKRNR